MYYSIKYEVVKLNFFKNIGTKINFIRNHINKKANVKNFSLALLIFVSMFVSFTYGNTLLADTNINDASQFLELTTNLVNVTFLHITNNQKPSVELLLPSELPFDSVIECLSRKLEVPSECLLLFKKGSVRRFVKATHSTLSQMLEQNEDFEKETKDNSLYYDVAPGNIHLYERCDITNIDLNGDIKDRSSIFLQRGQEKGQDLLNEISKNLTEPYLIFYSKNGNPCNFSLEDSVEFSHRCVVELGLPPPEEDEVQLRVIYAHPYYEINDDYQYIPYFINVKKDKPVSELLSEIAKEKDRKVWVLQGSIRKLEKVDTNDMKAEDIADMYIAIITPLNYSSSVMKMNK